MTVQEYKTKNLLSTEITSPGVAALVSTVAGPVFSATTGAQIPIDGGNSALGVSRHSITTAWSTAR